MQTQAFRATFHLPITGQRSRLVCLIIIVQFLFLWTQNITNYYANFISFHISYSFSGKIQESYLYKVKVQEPKLIHETFNQSFHHRP